jgi:hypothetical protein
MPNFPEHDKDRIENHVYYCCFNEPLPSNDRGTHIQTHRTALFRLSGIRGIHRDSKVIS